MAKWDTYRVYEAVSEIDDGKFVLPVIQRKLVWDEDKMTLLFDTLLKGDSFGGIMVIEEEKGNKPLFNFRPFTKDGGFIPSSQIQELDKTQYFVIDGQQRLQTFYIGLKGSINGKILYFDLYSDFTDEFEFKFESDATKLPKQPRDKSERQISEHFWYQVPALLTRLKATNDDEQVANEIIAKGAITNEMFIRHIRKNITAFYRNVLNAEVLGISTVIINTTYNEVENKQRIVELFRRLNDGGTKLSAFELVASILKGYSWEMEAFLDEVLERYAEIGLTQDNLIKLIFLLQDNHTKEMASIEATDAQFAIQNKERIKATLDSLVKFLKHSKLYDYYKNGNRSFIPLFFIAYHLYHKDIHTDNLPNYFDNFDAGNDDFSRMKRWLLHSLLNGVFRSKGAGWIPYKTGVRKLLDEIKKHKKVVFPIDNLFAVYKSHPIQFNTEYSYNNLDDLERSFLYYLMYDCSISIRVQDEDHIMPKSILEKINVDPLLINSIRNFQLLDSGTNRGEKNAKPFKEWINNSKYVKDKPAFVRRHLIPPPEALWDESEAQTFISLRGHLIADKIEHFLT